MSDRIRADTQFKCFQARLSCPLSQKEPLHMRLLQEVNFSETRMKWGGRFIFKKCRSVSDVKKAEANI